MSRLCIITILLTALVSIAGGSQLADAQEPRVRRNIANLSDQQIASLRRGVAVMKSRSPDDPTSWTFQAAIHGSPNLNGPLFNQCEHGTREFLVWHLCPFPKSWPLAAVKSVEEGSSPNLAA